MTSDVWERARPIVLAGIVLISFTALGLLAFQLRDVLLVLFLGIVLGVTLNPFTEFMRRFRVPRVGAILVVYGLVALLLVGVGIYAGLQIADQDYGAELDEIRRDYEDLRAGTDLPTAQEVEDALIDVGERVLSGLAGQVFSFISAIVGLVSILFTAILFSTTQDRLRDVTLSFFPPDLRDNVDQLLHKYAVGLRGFARGELIAMVTIGAVTFIGLSLLGVRLAAVLAFFAFLMELLPIIGPWIAFIPALVISLTQGPWMAVQVSILYLGIQMFENYVVTPLVHSRETEVPALLIFVAITVGGAMMGILGALIALPVAVILRITYIEVIKPWNQKRYNEVPEETSVVTSDEPVTVEGQ